MTHVSKLNGVDFDRLTLEQLEIMLVVELRRDITSLYADELSAEVIRRKEILELA
jgi:hypothetical protein